MTMTLRRTIATGVLLAGLMGCASNPTFFPQSAKLADESHKQALAYKDQAEKAWSRMLALFDKALA